jgi:hypothetical protein
MSDFTSRAPRRPLVYLNYTVSAPHSDEDEEKRLRQLTAAVKLETPASVDKEGLLKEILTEMTTVDGEEAEMMVSREK